MAFSKDVTIFRIICCVLIIISIFGLTLLALDVFTVPYLTPFAHFLKVLISPFVPIIMPLYIASAIKLYKHAPFPTRKQWLFQNGAIIFQQTPRVLGNLCTLYDWSKLGNGMGFMGTGLEAEGFCGLRKCTGGWVEAVLIGIVVVGESMQWKWDQGYVQKWVDALADQSIRKEMKKQGEAENESMENGEVLGEKAGQGLDQETSRP